MVTISGHLAGSKGFAPGASINSTGVASNMPRDFRNACWRKPPICNAIRAVPTSEDFTMTSVTDSKGP